MFKPFSSTYVKASLSIVWGVMLVSDVVLASGQMNRESEEYSDQVRWEFGLMSGVQRASWKGGHDTKHGFTFY
ncbi:hypothetical protein BTA35_0206225 [Oceanospirillum linum]|uniref:Uncharacterized protein n=1 Tax=Oceanospirillum linum TaxID=966 RepID=A0A1T1HCQ9_OCELI|nr:hypothetical protein BTA35_0206225 [Oceanospirillum linum]